MKLYQNAAEAHFYVAKETDDEVRRIAIANGRPLSAVYRELVEKGLVAGGYRNGVQDMAGMIREVLQETMRPQVERLASISAKGTQISTAAFFLAAYAGRLAVPEHLREEYDKLAAQARKLGVEYLKLAKDKSLDDFIAQGLTRMEDDRY